jgi:hypothetical protein
MNFKFTCELCKKEVKRGLKFRVEADQYDSESSLTGELYKDGICNSCMDKIKRKIESMTK